MKFETVLFTVAFLLLAVFSRPDSAATASPSLTPASAESPPPVLAIAVLQTEPGGVPEAEETPVKMDEHSAR